MDLQLPQAPDETPDAESASRARASQFMDRLVQRLHAIPGAEHVAAVNAVPMDGGLPDGMFLLVRPEENPKDFKEYGALAKDSQRRGTADFCAATPEYFPALGIPLLRGRLLESRDSFDAPHAAVINEALAKAKWPGRD